MVLHCADKSSSSMKGWINPHLPHSVFVFTGYALFNPVGRDPGKPACRSTGRHFVLMFALFSAFVTA